MGQLPWYRLEASRPFLHVGVDFGGPFYIKEKTHCNRGKCKVYLVSFVCMVSKAVHFELASDLSTETFLGALRRLFARRGIATDMYSDNATNFVGASRELKEMYVFLESEDYRSHLENFSAEKGVRWHFIPPRAPHFGGIWEASIKSAKHHMLRVVGQTLFTYEALYTFFVEVEAILNSRPLTPMSSDPDDLWALAPAHLLVGHSLTTIPERQLSEIPVNRLSTWQHIQRLKQHVWERWSKEYISELHQIYKWQSSSGNQVAVGDMVLIKEDGLAPLEWRLGRVVSTQPDESGIVRVATVKTASGKYKRCVKKLAVLPIDTSK